MLSTLEVGEASSAQRSTDGVSLCMPLGSLLIQGGRVVSCHLAPTEAAVVTAALAYRGVLCLAPGSPSTSLHMPLHLCISQADVCVLSLSVAALCLHPVVCVLSLSVGARRCPTPWCASYRCPLLSLSVAVPPSSLPCAAVWCRCCR
jgi:hypothetical protein